jgi:hypothetical protein
VAHVTPLPEPPPDEAQTAAIRAVRQRVDTLLADRLGIEPVPPTLSDAGLVIGLAQILELTPPEWQDLLERDGVLARLRSLADRLEALTIPGGNLAERWPTPTPRATAGTAGSRPAAPVPIARGG